MAEITAALVKELREKTGAGMMDCKRALGETAGDLEGAVDWLRKKGLSAAAKKAGRVAAEGLVGVTTKGTVGAAVEVNAETDFVARNDKFQGLVTAVTEAALSVGEDVEALKNASLPALGQTTQEHLTHLVATIGENMNLRRAKRLEVGKGAVVAYVHNALTPGLGKIGVLVALESEADNAALQALGKQLAMHVAAASPLFLDVKAVDQGSLDRERDVLKEQARASGKPEDIINKMVEGRLRKYYEEVVLLEQVYVIDGETKISKVVENAAKQAGKPIQLTGFVRYVLGDGIEKETQDFAAEVAATLKS
ncbi:MAG TPA: translation elongation factor Ts [Stellaceae bacterium]|jgi:elongation factor Ts|nr:translation elongation factor Ts [Stellaceae bacterium]